MAVNFNGPVTAGSMQVVDTVQGDLNVTVGGDEGYQNLLSRLEQICSDDELLKQIVMDSKSDDRQSILERLRGYMEKVNKTADTVKIFGEHALGAAKLIGLFLSTC